MARVMTAEEKKWQGRDYAYTLARAEQIKADKERLANAQKEAKNMVAEREAELSGMRKVAGRKTTVPQQKPQNNNAWGRDPFAFPR